MNYINKSYFTLTLVLILFACANALRLYKIEALPLWYDEVYTGTVTSGVGIAEEQRKFTHLKAISPAEFSNIDRIYHRDLTAVVSILAREDPRHSPLFYLVAHLFRGFFKNQSRYADRYTHALRANA